MILYAALPAQLSGPLNIGPGKLSMDNSDLPLRLTGEAKLGGDDTIRG
ncbi:hypothetical protein G7B21_29265, partial [Klebsiella pneumoniae]|nr:hypothetical protein [Klebsiella pneumoniae]